MKFVTCKDQPIVNLDDVSIIDMREEEKKYYIDFAFNKELFGDNVTKSYWTFSTKAGRNKALNKIIDLIRKEDTLHQSY